MATKNRSHYLYRVKEYHKKSFLAFENVFLVNLMRGSQKYAWNLVPTATCRGQTKKGQKKGLPDGLDWPCYYLSGTSMRFNLLAYFCNPLINSGNALVHVQQVQKPVDLLRPHILRLLVLLKLADFEAHNYLL